MLTRSMPSAATVWAVGRSVQATRQAALRRPLLLRPEFLRSMRYTRSLPVFSETSVRPSFLRTTPAKNPRTECGCQPVALMIAGMVLPCFRRSISMTQDCLDPSLREASPLLSLRAPAADRFVEALRVGIAGDGGSVAPEVTATSADDWSRAREPKGRVP